MGTLYGLEVSRVEGPSIWLHVTAAQPDCCPFHCTRLFGLQLVVDAVVAATRPSSRVSADGSTIENDALAGHPLITELRRRGTPANNDGWPPWQWDYGSTALDASPWVDVVEILGVDGVPWNYGDTHDPSADYRIAVRQDRFLDSIERGLVFGSAAYDDGDANPPMPMTRIDVPMRSPG